MDLETNKLFLCASEKKIKEHQNFIDDLSTEFEVKNLESIKKQEESIIVALGGDGTLNHLVNNISEFRNLKILYFPSGTANDFARSLKVSLLSPTLSHVKKIIRSSPTIKVPLMKCNDQRFINVATAGAPAKVTDSGSSLVKEYTGKVSYYLNALEEMISPSKFFIKFEMEDSKGKICREELSNYGFIVSQGLFAGGGVKVSTNIVPDFLNEFNFLIAREGNLAASMKDLLLIQKKEFEQLPEDSTVISVPLRKLKIQSDEPIPLKLDGEDYQEKSLEFMKDGNELQFYFY